MKIEKAENLNITSSEQKKIGKSAYEDTQQFLQDNY